MKEALLKKIISLLELAADRRYDSLDLGSGYF
jgi:hypothetical protein